MCFTRILSYYTSTRIYVMPKRSAQWSGTCIGAFRLSGQQLSTTVLMFRC